MTLAPTVANRPRIGAGERAWTSFHAPPNDLPSAWPKSSAGEFKQLANPSRSRRLNLNGSDNLRRTTELLLGRQKYLADVFSILNMVMGSCDIFERESRINDRLDDALLIEV